MRLDDDLPVLVVSPHLDDAMLSCAALFQRSRPAAVLTVFAGRPRPPVSGEWDRLCGFADSDEAAAVRRAEDRAAFAGLAVEPVYLPLIDAQYTRGAQRSEEERNVVREAVADWLTWHASAFVALPAGCGRTRRSWTQRMLGSVVRRTGRLKAPEGPAAHRDHVFVRDVCLGLLAEQARARALLYEEVPYGMGVADTAFVRRAVGRAWAPVELEVEVDVGEKTARLAAYATQLGQLTGGDPRAGLSASERYWLLEPRRREKGP
jgi:LmbE family N-acetylglucosaminyl deacetylase